MMNQQPAQDTVQPLTFLLELTADETEESDPALVHAIGRDTVEALQDENIPVQPVYTGQQGGDFLVQIVPTVVQFATAAWDHRAVIEELLNDASQLAALATFIYKVVKHVKDSYEQRVGHDESVARPIKSTLELGVDARPLDASDLLQIQAELTALLEQHKATHADTRTRPSQKLKIRHTIPRKRAAGKRKRGKK
jgi:hypothetical protein